MLKTIPSISTKIIKYHTLVNINPILIKSSLIYKSYYSYISPIDKPIFSLSLISF